MARKSHEDVVQEIADAIGEEQLDDTQSSLVQSLLDGLRKAKKPLESKFVSPLAIAAEFGPPEWVTRLIELGADVAWVGHSGETVAAAAVSGKRWEVVEKLLDAKTPFRALDLRHAPADLLEKLLPRLSLSPSEVANLLIFALANPQPEGVSLLLGRVADPNVIGTGDWGTKYEDRHIGGVSPLHAAAAAGHLAHVRALVERGARPDLPLPRASRIGTDALPEGTTPLGAAQIARKRLLTEGKDTAALREVEAFLGGLAAGAVEAPVPAPAAAKKAPHHEAIDEALRELARLGGNDLPALQRRLDSMILAQGGAWNTLHDVPEPWLYLLVALREGRGELLSEMALQKLAGTPLLRFLQGRYHDPSDEPVEELRPRKLAQYPKDARPVLANGVIVGSTDADLYVVSRRAGEEQWALYHTHPEGLWCLGDSPAAFLQEQMRALRG